MIYIYLEKDLERLLERYIHQREIVGLSREEARRVAWADVKESVSSKKALAEARVIPTDEQTRLIEATQKVTDKLPGIWLALEDGSNG